MSGFTSAGGAERGAPSRGRCRAAGAAGAAARWTGAGGEVTGAGAGAGAGSAGGTAAVCCRSAGPVGRVVGGVAEVTGSGAAGPGCVSGVRVTDGFPVIGAPRPMRRTPVEALRCTGYGPDPADPAGAV
ncbi:hypothetical protein [Streptomyces sp. NPDC127119]|uniref:hypothetical protein n=1 Tax=Streptomyces sp. NPDC127119 TaxID=3345370 RepID=UPI00363263F2